MTINELIEKQHSEHENRRIRFNLKQRKRRYTSNPVFEMMNHFNEMLKRSNTVDAEFEIVEPEDQEKPLQIIPYDNK